MDAASMEARFWFSPSRGRMTWREPSELIFPLTGPNDWCPLVVIDPEDREQVDRLYRLYVKHSPAIDNGYTAEMQAALREFASPQPPKPEEPTGLGAVVEDANGVLWTRADGDPLPWLNSESSGDYWLAFADINAVRVLSEGVQP